MKHDEPEGKRGWPLRLAAFSILFLLPFALRQIPINHGIPRNYLPDTHVVRQALGMARDKDPVPQVGTYSTYPNLLAYTLLPVYAGQYFMGRALGEWSGSGEYANVIKEDPGRAHLPAREWFAALTALAAFFLYRAGRAAGLKTGAWAAALFAGTSLLYLQLSLHERPWGPLTAFTALAIWPAVNHARTGKAVDLVLCGLAAGLCIATHQAGGLVLGLAGLAWLLAPRSADTPEGNSASWFRERFTRGVVAVLGFGIAGLLLGYGHVLIKSGADPGAISGAGLEIEKGLAIGGQAMPYGLQLESFPRMVSAFFAYDPVLAIFGVVGLFVAWKNRALRPVVLFALLWTAIFTTNKNDYVRYLVPLVAPLALLAGAAFEALAERSRRLPGGVAVLGLIAFAFPLVQATRLAFVFSKTDTRALAEEKLQALPQGAVVAIDRYGPDVPLDRTALERLERLRRPGELRSRETHRLVLLTEELYERAGPDLNALRVEEIIEFPKGKKPQIREAPEGNALRATIVEQKPLDALRTLGCTHLVSVTRRPDRDDETLVAPEREPLWTIDPTVEGKPFREALLPLETDRGWRALWEVERPGPRLRLIEL